MEIIKSHVFNDFTVLSLNEKCSFMHIRLADNNLFYKDMFSYFFCETRILKYIENKAGLTFTPTRENYITIFKHLGQYIDEFNMKRLPAEIEAEVAKVLADEYDLNDDGDGHLHVRLDKMGKIGEYIFYNLLSEYFGFSCIIPKVHLTTDYNMSVYGIDALFYSPSENMILFGESKLSKSLANGISLINESLKSYEKQIVDEFTLILSNRLLRNNMGVFGDRYAETIERSISIEEFISAANIERIAVPLFIAHGQETNPDEIFRQLNNIKHPAILNMETTYLVISLPLLSKAKMISSFTEAIAERRAQYEYAAAHL